MARYLITLLKTILCSEITTYIIIIYGSDRYCVWPDRYQ